MTVSRLIYCDICDDAEYVISSGDRNDFVDDWEQARPDGTWAMIGDLAVEEISDGAVHRCFACAEKDMPYVPLDPAIRPVFTCIICKEPMTLQKRADREFTSRSGNLTVRLDFWVCLEHKTYSTDIYPLLP